MEEKSVKIDKKDIEILAEMRRNCRVSVKTIAIKTKMHPNTVLQRIKRLEKEGIIRGYRADVNFRKIGYDFHALVMLKSNEPQTIKDEGTNRKLLQIPEVEAVYAVTGENDWAVLVRARDREHFMHVLQEIQGTGKKSTTYIILVTERDPFGFNPL
jgi:Lrp/AsnC family leucine-responsive transcriptional regulator